MAVSTWRWLGLPCPRRTNGVVGAGQPSPSSPLVGGSWPATAGLVRAPLPLRAPLSAASPPPLLVPLTAQQSSLWVVRITAQTAEVMALQRSVRGL